MDLFNDVRGGKYNTVIEALGDCSKWMRVRRKRNAPPVDVCFWEQCLNYGYTTNTGCNSDDIVSRLFDASLFDGRINCILRYRDTIHIYWDIDSKGTNIDLSVMDAISSWFNNEDDNTNGETNYEIQTLHKGTGV